MSQVLRLTNHAGNEEPVLKCTVVTESQLCSLRCLMGTMTAPAVGRSCEGQLLGTARTRDTVFSLDLPESPGSAQQPQVAPDPGRTAPCACFWFVLVQNGGPKPPVLLLPKTTQRPYDEQVPESKEDRERRELVP